MKINIRGLDEAAMAQARARQHELLKPVGSLGELERISIQIAGITGKVQNSIDRKIHFLFGSDHGVFDEGVSASPQYFTKVLMTLYGSPDGGGAINALCRKNNIELRVFDLGVKDLAACPGVDSSHKLMTEGTHNFARVEDGKPVRAMSLDTVNRAIELGINLAAEAKSQNFEIIGAGEVGMANTTPAAACIMAALGTYDAALVGRGGGLTDEAFERKKRVIVSALNRHKPNKDDAVEILSCVGGLDIAAMTGIFLGAAACRVPVVVDGVIAIAAALLATKLEPLSRDFMIPSHMSEEPAYSKAAEAMKLKPFLTLGMRLGEGSGCPIAMQVVADALAVMNDMKTFGEINLESDYRKELTQ